MDNLPPDCPFEDHRLIANALLTEGYEEGLAIRIAIAKAKEWAARHEVLLSIAQ